MKRRLRLSGAGCLGALLVIAGVYVASVLWWGMWLYFGVHWSGAETWSYSYTITHWALLAPFVAG